MKTIQEIYTMSANYLAGDETNTSHYIIEEAIDTLKDSEDENLNELWETLVYHINGWNNNSLAEQVQESDELIEDITGYLGEYLAD